MKAKKASQSASLFFCKNTENTRKRTIINMKTSFALSLLTLVLIPITVFAETHIGVAGALDATMIEGKKVDLNFTDLRFKVSGKMTDAAKFNAVINPNNTSEVREAYVTVRDPFKELGFEKYSNRALSVQAGRKYVSFGANNGTYVEDLRGVNRPHSAEALLGATGLLGRGLGLLYETKALGTPLKAEVFLYNTVDILGDVVSQEDPLYETGSSTLAVRITSKIESINLDYGISALQNNVQASVARDKITFYGVDATHSSPFMGQILELEGEFIAATYERITEETIIRTGVTVYGGIGWDNNWETGIRVDGLSSIAAEEISGSENLEAYYEAAFIGIRTLSSTTDFRIQYGIKSGAQNGEALSSDDAYLLASLVFNL